MMNVSDVLSAQGAQKQCRRCELTKSTDHFYRNWRNTDGLHSYCKECQKVYSSDAYERAKEKNRVLSAAPITVPAPVNGLSFGILHDAQGGLCAFCAEELSGVFAVGMLIPAHMKGAMDYGNVVLSCASCNEQKGDNQMMPVTPYATHQDAIPTVTLPAQLPVYAPTGFKHCATCGKDVPKKGWYNLADEWCIECVKRENGMGYLI